MSFKLIINMMRKENKIIFIHLFVLEHLSDKSLYANQMILHIKYRIVSSQGTYKELKTIKKFASGNLSTFRIFFGVSSERVRYFLIITTLHESYKY